MELHRRFFPVALCQFEKREERQREKETESPDGCSLGGKVGQWRLGGHRFNPYIPQWHLMNKEVCIYNMEQSKLD